MPTKPTKPTMTTRPTGNRTLDEFFTEARRPIYAPGMQSSEKKLYALFRSLETNCCSKFPDINELIRVMWRKYRARAVRLAEVEDSDYPEVLWAIAGNETTDSAEMWFEKKWAEILLSVAGAQFDEKRFERDVLEANRWRSVLLGGPFRLKRNAAIAAYRQKIHAGGDERWLAPILLRRIDAINSLERLQGEVLSFAKQSAIARGPGRRATRRPTRRPTRRKVATR